MRKQIHVLVSGRVQGVGFRWSTLDVAHQLHVQGWVRNRTDGRVEVVAEAEEKILEQFIAFLWQGPRYAKVKNVEIEWSDATGEFTKFQLKH